MKTHTYIVCKILLDLMDYNKMIKLDDKLNMYQRLQFKFVE